MTSLAEGSSCRFFTLLVPHGIKRGRKEARRKDVLKQNPAVVTQETGLGEGDPLVTFLISLTLPSPGDEVRRLYLRFSWDLCLCACLSSGYALGQ